MTPIYLIDGSGYIFRAFYAIRPLSNASGLPTNAIYGFTQMLLKFLRESQPTHAAVVFDTKAPSFRSDLFAEYKANRKEPPEELVPQFPYFRKIVEALGIPMFEQDGFEADDIIATIATRMAKRGHEVVIITGDKDFMQLVDDRITLWDTMKEKRVNAEEVRKRFGVDPAQVVDVQGLAGDSVDNVKGVPGIGEKTATKLIQQYGTLDRLLEHAGAIPGKVGERLRAHADDARLARRLCTLHPDVAVADGEESLRVHPARNDALRELFREFEFAKLLQTIVDPLPAATARSAYHLVMTPEQLTHLVARIQQTRVFAIDTETVGLNPRHATLVGISIAVAEGEAYYLPIAHRTADTGSQLPIATVVAALQPLCQDASIRILCHHAKFDLPILRRYGLAIETIAGDTLIASYLLDPSGSHSLDTLAERYCQHRMIRYEEVVGTGPTQKTFDEIALETACDYAAEDADFTLRLANHCLPELETQGLLSVFREIEMPLINILIEMEATGFTLDTPYLQRLQQEFAGRLTALRQQIYAAAGEEFNIASAQQLGVILFEKLQLPGKRKTKTGYATDADTLEKLATSHPLPQLILDYRSLAKLQSTYIEALPKLVDATTGRLHTTFQQTMTATGRLSSRDPNLQNIPIRSDEGRRIREAFVAAPGHRLLSADYSQIELRILAHLSEDERLLEAFRQDRDIHAETAAFLFGVPLAQLTDAQRGLGKTVNFAVIYGQTAYGMAKQLHIPPGQAQEYIEQYFALYPGVADYRNAILAQARKILAVRTLYGRRRPMPEINNSQAFVRSEAERMAFNAVIQGTAADMMKLAMIAIAKNLAARRMETKILLQIHDELILEVPDHEQLDLMTLVQSTMEQIKPPTGAFRVPLTVNLHLGHTWAEC